jgi:hypothetical protein
MSRYICTVRSPSTYAREYTVTTSSAYKAAQDLGRGESGETVEITRPRSGRVVSAAMWSSEGRRYYRVYCGGDALC